MTAKGQATAKADPYGMTNKRTDNSNSNGNGNRNSNRNGNRNRNGGLREE